MRMIAVLIGMVTVGQSHAEEFHFDFRQGTADQPFLVPTGPSASQSMQPDPRGLHIILAPKRVHLDPVGVKTRFGVQGDFEVTASYELLKADEPPKGFGAGARLYLKFDSPTHDVISLSRVYRPKEGNEFVAYHVLTDKGGMQKDRSRSGPAKSPTGRLRVSRIGSSLSFLVDDGQNTFLELFSADVGTGAALDVSLTGTTGGEPCGVDLRWFDLHIRADALPSDVSPTLSAKYIWWVSTGIGVIFLVGAGFVIRRWLRSTVQSKRS